MPEKIKPQNPELNLQSKLSKISLALFSSLNLLATPSAIADTWDKQPNPNDFVSDGISSCKLIEKYSNKNTARNNSQIKNKINFTGTEIAQNRRNTLFETIRKNGGSYYGTDRMELWKLDIAKERDPLSQPLVPTKTQTLYEKLRKNVGNKKLDLSDYDFFVLTSPTPDAAWSLLINESNIESLPNNLKDKAKNYLESNVKSEFYSFYEFLKYSTNLNNENQDILKLEGEIFNSINSKFAKNNKSETDTMATYLKFFNSSNLDSEKITAKYNQLTPKIQEYQNQLKFIQSKYTKKYNSEELVDGKKFNGSFLDFLLRFVPNQNIQTNSNADQILEVFIGVMKKDPRFKSMNEAEIQQYARKEVYSDIQNFVTSRDDLHQSILRGKVQSQNSQGVTQTLITPVDSFTESKEYKDLSIKSEIGEISLNEFQLYNIQEKDQGNKSKPNYYSKIAEVTKGIHTVEDLLKQHLDEENEKEFKPMSWTGPELYDLLIENIGMPKQNLDIKSRSSIEAKAKEIKLTLEIIRRASIYSKTKFLFWEENNLQRTQILEDDDINKLYPKIEALIFNLQDSYLKSVNNSKPNLAEQKNSLLPLFESIAKGINLELDNARNTRLSTNSKLKEIGNNDDCGFVTFSKSGNHYDMEPEYIKQVLVNAKINKSSRTTTEPPYLFNLRNTTVSLVKMMDPELKKISENKIADIIQAYMEWTKTEEDTTNQFITEIKRIKSEQDIKDGFDSINWGIFVNIASLIALGGAGLYLSKKVPLEAKKWELKTEKEKELKKWEKAQMEREIRLDPDGKNVINVNLRDLENGNLNRKETEAVISVIDKNSKKSIEAVLDEKILFDNIYAGQYEIKNSFVNISRMFEKFEDSSSIIDLLVTLDLLFSNIYEQYAAKTLETVTGYGDSFMYSVDFIALQDLVSEIGMIFQEINNITDKPELYSDFLKVTTKTTSKGNSIEFEKGTGYFKVQKILMNKLNEIYVAIEKVNGPNMIEYLDNITTEELEENEIISKFVNVKNLQFDKNSKNIQLILIQELIKKATSQIRKDELNMTGLELPLGSIEENQSNILVSYKNNLTEYKTKWKSLNQKINNKHSKDFSIINNIIMEKKRQQEVEEEAQRRDKEQEVQSQYQKNQETINAKIDALESELLLNQNNETFGPILACPLIIFLTQFMEGSNEKKLVAELIESLMLNFDNLDHYYTPSEMLTFNNIKINIQKLAQNNNCSRSIKVLNLFLESNQLDKFINGSKFEKPTELDLAKLGRIYEIYSQNNH